MKRRTTRKATKKTAGEPELSGSETVSKEEISKPEASKAEPARAIAAVKKTADPLPKETPEPIAAKPGTPAVTSAAADKTAVQEVAPQKRPDSTPQPPAPPAFRLPIPSILLEGDQPEPPSKTGPGEKFAVGAGSAKEVAHGAEQLPPSYGTGRVKAIARDPYCLFVSWDFTESQQRYYNSLSADKHLVLRAHRDSLYGPVAAEAHLHGETRHWFLRVPQAGARYLVEIGYYLPDGAWITVRSSEPVSTQPDRPSEDQTVRFAYAAAFRPPDETISQPPLPGPLLHERREGEESARVSEFHQTIHTPVLPEPRPQVEYPQWTAVQEEALTELISTMIRREQVPGSLEILELLQRQVRRPIIPLEQELGVFGPSSAALGISSLPQQEQLPSSLVEGERLPPRKGFWFNVNAELIIYGATEPDARVTIGGRAIKLRPDGTFSYRFALPDGYYELPAEATSSDQTDSRRAELRFSRHTSYGGEVGAHPQDRALQTPAPENVA